ncbi:MAG: hydroxyacid dehydrogenase [Acidobacteria bacterium RIFCSPLOWO2_12_FULL_67_14]|nr:MAG: hydroxyacid dehydrogenase [Acidobacteria bacterium RIFCSPLOWO2_02_FULL_67_21]OFW36560.1 MAG: hydroxyacid dehydrogenase [Acidobacteria bacterium RIFCSPLOWO2_12_FULL_67_14]
MRVLVADAFESSGLEGLSAAGCEVLYQPDLSGDALEQALRVSEPDVLVVRSTRVTEPMLDAGPRLSLVVRAGAGVNTIDVAAAARRGIYVSNCPGRNSTAVAELAIGLLIALDRRIPDNVAELRAGRWNKKKFASESRGLYGRTLGLLGFGSIGQEVARRARAFGMEVIVWSPRFLRDGAAALAALPRDLEVTVFRSPEDVAARSDALSVHLALTPETGHFVGASILSRLKPGALFVNTARAELVDEAALRQAVETGGVRAALDVFAGEPAAGAAEFSPPLAALPGVYGTHHIGASTEQAQEAIAAEAVRVIRTYRDSGKVPNVVNLASRTPATHTLIVRHRDRPGVLADVFAQLRLRDLNVQETENVIFEGAEAAVARISLDSEPDGALLQAIRTANPDVLSLQVVKR